VSSERSLDGLILDRHLQKLLPHHLGILGRQATGRPKDSRLVFPARMVRVETIVGQLIDIDYRAITVWESHLAVASSTSRISLSERP
jgi:hypothetical protein